MSLEGQQLGRYQLQRLLGSGGMGEIYLATDTSIHRSVAIKVIRAEAASYPDVTAMNEVARLFQREMRAIARLDHPFILPLFDYGEEQADRTNLAYMVMPYRQEGSLADWLHRRESTALLSPEEVEHIIQQAASALQYAHSQQILHQDVKPSNFLIRSREEQPQYPDVLLADFGVAKFTSATSNLSQAIRGTPAYMAPEQWEGNPVPATDQYALAVMAYELLTGHPPFKGGLAQMMYQHFHVQPVPPSTLNSRIPEALNAVLLHSLAKKPEERFASMAAFAKAFQQAVSPMEAPAPSKSPPVQSNDLHATLAISQQEAQTGTSRTLTLPGGQRVTVEVPAGTRDEQVLRLEGQGGPSEGGMTGALLLTLAVITAEVMEPLADPQQAEALTVMTDASPGPVSPVTPSGQSSKPSEASSPAIETYQPTVPASQSKQPPAPAKASSPAIETYQPTVPASQSKQPPAPAKVSSPAHTPEPQVSTQGRGISRRRVLVGLAALTAAGGGLTWWYVSRKQGTLFYTYRGHTDSVNAVAWSPDGSRIASGSSDDTVQVWNATDGSHPYTYRGHKSTVYAVAWSPDSSRIASASFDHTVQVWNATDGSHPYTYRGHKSAVNAVAWSPDSSRIASASFDNTVQVWNATDGSHPYTYRGHKSAVYAVAWSPDSSRIASASFDNTVQVWNATDGSNSYTYRGHKSAVLAVAWSPDGSRIASASADQTVQVWNAADGSNSYTYSGHTDIVNAVAWSPDGSHIASASADGTVQVWNAADFSSLYTYTGHTNSVHAVTWSPYDSRIASASNDHTVQVWQGV